MRQKGFSLIEAMVAIAIIAVLAAGAFPAFTQMRLRHELRGVADALMASLAERRLEGMRTNRNMNIDFNAIIDQTGPQTTVVSNTVGGSTADDGAVILEPRIGMLTDPLDAGAIEIINGDYGVRFSLNSMGRAFTCVPSGQLSPSDMDACP